jgi:hydroxymethylbilane synthase
MTLKISSRQSVLAQTQAYQVGEALQKITDNLQIDYLFRESLGDKNLSDPLWKMPEKGVFTEDFYKDLLQNQTDLVVHSWKDLPTEEKPDTRIVATLPRADQRDLLLFKKSSLGRKDLKIFSSSPRRAYNLKEFFTWALPWAADALEFTSVRGNIPTRIKKLLEDPGVDGLVLAKAAMDRLLGDLRFPETVDFLRMALDQCQWMVLPLTENPNAAAQGALAVEIATHRTEILDLLIPMNCQKTFLSAQREREILKEFGGGCHLALGMSVLQRSYGRLEIVKGLTPKGEHLHLKKFIPKKPLPAGIQTSRLEFSSERTANQVVIGNVDALFVAKAEAWTSQAAACKVLWTAGLQTWKKLSKLGVWVNGSAEGLGETENPDIEALLARKPKWGRLSHDQADESSDKKSFETYSLKLSLLSKDVGAAQAFHWKSASEFRLALRQFPGLKSKLHICGPGRTFEAIKEELKSEHNIFVELSDGFITAV